MKLPTLNLNGTSREELLEGYGKARRALTDAISELCSVWPHGRDYQYPGGDADYRIAREEHADRVRALGKVEADLEALIQHIV